MSINRDIFGIFVGLRLSACRENFWKLRRQDRKRCLAIRQLRFTADDDRYKDLIGREVELPLTGRLIPIIADEHADMTKGTGVVKITPAHDPNDYEVGKRHHLEEINILNDDGTIAETGGKYAGMDRYEARRAIVEDLKVLGLLGEIEELTHSVGTHDRCKTVIEPMIKPQWFVAMKELAKPPRKQ